MGVYRSRLVYQSNPKRLNEDQVGTFQQELGSSLGQLDELASPEQIWGQFKSSMLSAQQSLPAVWNQEDVDWITDELRTLSQLKKQHWLRCKTSSNDLRLRAEYTRIKLLTSRKAEGQ